MASLTSLHILARAGADCLRSDIELNPSQKPALFAKLLEKRNVKDKITNVGSDGDGAPVASAASTSKGGAEAPSPVEEKKEEPKEESDEDMGFSLFD
ncbi:hypothetical protein L7F22_058915 [Adiantum nelumboides]|nr:hypothetical protein [Adiantum nelumboides]